MTTSFEQEVFDRLPAFYRERDARPDGNPGFLESVLTIIAEQLEIVGADLDQLYDDLFIETCDSWVVPYIGDLVAVTPGAPVDSDAVLTRAAVADAIALRRRKGTIAVLEQLARDVTGWPAVALEMFERTAITQDLQHVVATRGTTMAMGAPLPLERVGRTFDTAAHTLEVRRIGSGRGRYDVQNIAIMVWRDAVLTHTEVDATAVDAQRFRVDPLGTDQPLTVQPRTEVLLTHRATPVNVPGPLTRRAMAASPEEFYGPGLSVIVWSQAGPTPTAVSDVVVCDLSDSAPNGATWSNVSRLKASQLGVDPQLGRLAFGQAQASPPRVSFVTTTPSDIGGNEIRTRPATPADSTVTPVRRDGAGGLATTVAAGLAASNGLGSVEIRDSRTYEGDLAVTVPAAGQLRVTSADGFAPVVVLDDAWTVTVGEGGILELVGLIVAGGPLIVRGRPARIEIQDCTFVPGYRLDITAGVSPPVGPSLVLDLDVDWQTDVTLDGCLTGPLHVPADGTTVTVSDSIIDGVEDGLGRAAAAGAPARLVPVLRSPGPVGPLALPAGSTTLRLIVGTDAPRVIDLGSAPTDAPSAATLLGPALVGTGVRAVEADDRVVLVGDGRPLAVAAEGTSTLADALGLTTPPAHTIAVVGASVDIPAASAGGTISITAGHALPLTVTVAASAADLASVAPAVQAAVRAASPSLTAALVVGLDGALILVPPDAVAVTVAGTAADLITAWSLGLVSARPAIAADASGSAGATLGLARCTVLGDVAVTAVDVISDSIVTGLVSCERRQIGCVQYSWIAPGSTTPRQHECQPATSETPPPSFVSIHYSTPGYARLRREGATAIVRGASDGFEMGAMARLRQTQRDDNLRRGIAEFLRFGLEAGVLDGD